MLKRFFISMLGTMAGLWLSLIFLFFGLIAAVAVLVSSAVGQSSVMGKDNILYLKLDGDIPERQAELDIYSLVGGGLSESDNLADIVASIRLAAKDSRIKGLYIDSYGSSLGVASRSEVVEAIEDFKASGKWVYAYADNFTQGDYYVSSVADKVFLNPVGSIDVRGVSATTLFFKNLLDKLGIEVQIVKVGSFKSAVEPFIRTDMSEPSRLQTTVFVNSIWGDITQTIAKGRGIEPKTVCAWADSLAFTWAPERYVDQRAVTELRYRNDVENTLRDLVDVDRDKDLPLVTPTQYMAENAGKLGETSKKHIAVLYAVGDITDDGNSGIVGQTMVPQIYKLAKDKNVAGMVLRVNSGGGSAFASEQIWKALEDFKAEGKPLYVSMGDYAASGGYYISCGADSIYADASTLTGSIGIFGMLPNAERLLKDKVGINYEPVKSSPNADFPTLYAAGTPQQLAAMQSYVERGYETFTSRVAAGRHLPIDSVKAIGGGRVWDGKSALSLGLVDHLGSLDAAVKSMARRLDLEPDKYVCYPEKKDKWMALLESATGAEAAADVLPAEMRQALEVSTMVRNLDPLQARMEKIVIE